MSVAARKVGPRLVYREAFAINDRPWVDYGRPGATLLQMAREVPVLPKHFFERHTDGVPFGEIKLNGFTIPHELWGTLKPRASAANDNKPIIISFHLAPGRGGGNSGKVIGQLVAALALTIVTAGLASGWAATYLGASQALFGAGTIGARVLAGAVGLVGALAISALAPPPARANFNQPQTNTDQTQPASATGNVLQPGGSIPRVIGTRKIFPPFIGEPVIELVGGDEVIECAVCANGPHKFESPSVQSVSIEDADDVEYETREGWDDDAPLTLVSRQGKGITPNIQMSYHAVDSSNQQQLAHPANPTKDLPVWHNISSFTNPDEIWVHLTLPSGISVNGSTNEVGIPFRIGIRKKGSSTWIQLPEIHLSDATLQQRKRALLFKFQKAPDLLPYVIPPQTGGFVYAHINVPGQSLDPLTAGWAADSYFVGPSGNDYMAYNTIGNTKVQNIALYDNRAEIFLDPATFTPGGYEIQIKRGTAYYRTSFNNANYTYGGVALDMFSYHMSGTSPIITMTRANLADLVQISRVQSIWNKYPILKPGLALLAIRARNRQLSDIAVIASGYVKDWDGTGWNNWVTTSNPAPHYVDILSGKLNLDPLDPSLRDDETIVEWRQTCEDNGWKCDLLVDDFRTQDALNLVAACGYAKTYQCEIYSVLVDLDRTAEDPVQSFSRRTCTNVRYERAFVRVPEGFIVNFTDKTQDYSGAQVIVYQRDRSIAQPGLLETTTYDGLVDRDAVIARAQFDLDQGNLRAVFYYLDAEIQTLNCRRGSLVALEHDVLSVNHGGAYIKRKITKEGNIIALELDSKIPTANEPDMHNVVDMHAIKDMHKVGMRAGIAIRRSDGTISSHAISNSIGEDNIVYLETPVADDDIFVSGEDSPDEACLVMSGLLGQEYLRLYVSDIQRGDGLNATLTLVDEAPELERYAA
jgi:hypothetical protein